MTGAKWSGVCNVQSWRPTFFDPLMLREQDSMTPLLTWFGDDFTGSAAVMEVLTFAGVDSVLFSAVPSDELRARFGQARAIGIASTARAQDPAWMDENLPEPFAFLHGLGAPILHYKVCSTFDSSPQSGNIGKAVEIGLAIRPAVAVPVLTAAPQQRRYQAFGHLFAGSFDGVHRLDRHPVMVRHPVTPMDEADLMVHLSRQTTLPTALIALEALWSDPQEALELALAGGARILSIDSMEPASELAAGRLIWENRDRFGFVVGSQGVECALVRHWLAIGLLEAAPPLRSAGKHSQIAGISGSVSPTTARQIEWASQNGFALVAFDASKCVEGDRGLSGEIERATGLALEAASRGASPLVHSAKGPNDPSVEQLRAALSNSGMKGEEGNMRIGQSLGKVLEKILSGSGIRRAIVAGGDTSGHAMHELGLEALVAVAPTIPGAALCRAYGGSAHDGLEIALKGGQMGSEDFFGWIRDGGGPR
jgi:3-oxoisoapionate kinase